MSGIGTTDALNTIEEDEFSGWDMVQNLESQSNEDYEPSIGPQILSDSAKYEHVGESIYRSSFVKPPGELDPSYGWKSGERLENHERVVNNSSLSLQPTVPEFFWERQDSWLGQVFGKRDISSVELVIGPEPKYSRVDPPLFEKPVQQQTDEPLYSRKQSSGESSKPYYLFAVSKNTSREGNDKRQDMYGEWANLIVMNIDAFTICGALSAKNRYTMFHCFVALSLGGATPFVKTVARAPPPLSR